MTNILSFNKVIETLNTFWQNNGCVLLQPFDSEVGAATFHSATFFNAVTNRSCKIIYTQFSRRPFDVKYNTISNKSSIFHQYQVIIKPSTSNIKELYLLSLQKIGINMNNNDIRFLEDNWSSPTLGAGGIGWEVRLNGIEVTQFTYFQQMGGLECFPVMVEIAYGLERLASHIQNIQNFHDIIFDNSNNNIIKYGDIFAQYEKEYTEYLSTSLDLVDLNNEFNSLEKKIDKLILKRLPFIAYDYLVKISHIFNLIDSCMCYGFARQNYISRIKILSEKIAIEVKNDK